MRIHKRIVGSENYRKELMQELKDLRDEPKADRAGWDALRLAEFLVSRPGLDSRGGYIC
jgi:hypothetical protein